MTINLEALKAQAEMHIKRGDSMQMDPKVIAGLLADLYSLKVECDMKDFKISDLRERLKQTEHITRESIDGLTAKQII